MSPIRAFFASLWWETEAEYERRHAAARERMRAHFHGYEFRKAERESISHCLQPDQFREFMRGEYRPW